MSQSVDTKIVELKFNNDNFAEKVDSTLDKLQNLNKAIDEDGLSNALKNLGKNAKHVDMKGVTDGVEEARKGFSKLEIAGITALANISNAAVNLGKRLVSKLVSPLTQGIMQGGLARARNIEQASFQFEGQKIGKSAGHEGLSYYHEVMEAVLGTAYSYDVAAKAASQLAASNVGVEKTTRKLADGSKIEAKVLNGDMTKALLAIAGTASMTGSDFDSIAQIFTRVAGQGKVMAMDLNSIAARGLNAAAVLANSLGKTEAQIRDMVSKGKISFADFSNAMSDAFGQHAKDSTLLFQGALEDVKAALARIGADFYGPALNAGRDILNSVTPLVDALHSKLNPALEKSGNIMDKASKNLSQYLDMLSYMIERFPDNDMNDWINEHMNAWTNIADLYKKGNLQKTVEGLKEYSKAFKGMEGKKGINGYKMLGDYLDIASNGDALSKYLNKTDKDIEKITKKGKISAEDLKTVIDGMIKDGTIGFNTFYKSFHKLWSESTDLMAIGTINKDFNEYVKTCIEADGESERFTTHLQTFNSIVNGTLSVFNSFKTILGGFADIFLTLAQHLKPLGSLFVNATKDLAQFVVYVADFIATSESFHTILDGTISLIKKFFELVNVSKLAGAALAGIGKVFDFIAKAIEKVDVGLTKVYTAIHNVLTRLIDKIIEIINDTELLHSIFEDLKHAGMIVAIVNLIGALTRPMDMLRSFGKAVENVGDSFSKFIGQIGEVFKSIAGMLGKIGKVIDEVTNTLKRMQELIVATAILEIAVAIAVLAGALYLLSKVKVEGAVDAIKPLFGLVASVGALLSFMVAMKKYSKDIEDVDKIGHAFLEFAAAIAIVAAAVYALSKIDGKGLMRATASVEILMITMAAIAKILAGKTTKDTGLKALWSGKKVSTGSITKGLTGLIAMAEAVNILAKALSKIATIDDPHKIMYALGAIEALLWSLFGITKLLSEDKAAKMTKGATTLLAMAVAIRLLTKPLIELSALNSDALTQGVVGVGLLVVALGALVKIMSGTKGTIKAAAAMLIVAFAIKSLQEVVLTFSKMDFNGLVQGIGGIVGMLIGFALALDFIDPTSILVKAASIYIITKALVQLQTIVANFASDPGGMLNGIAVLGAALGALFGAVMIFKYAPTAGILKLFATLALGAVIVAAFGAAIGVFGIGMGIFAVGLRSLASAAAEAQSVGGTIIGIMAGFAIAIAVLTTVGLPAIGVILAISLAFVMLGAGMALLGSGLDSVAGAIRVMTELKGELKDTAAEMAAFIHDLGTLSNDSSKIGESFASIAEPLTKIKESAEKLTDTISKLSSQYTEMLTQTSTSMIDLSTALSSIAHINEYSMTKATEVVKNFITSLKDMSADTQTIGQMGTDISNAIGLIETSLQGVITTMDNFAVTSKNEFSAMGESLNSIVTPLQVLDNMKAKLQGLSDSLVSFFGTVATLKDQSATVQEGAMAITASLADVSNASNAMKTAFEGLTAATATVLTNIGSGLKTIADGAQSMVSVKDNLASATDAFTKFFDKLSELSGMAASISQGTNTIAAAVRSLGSAASRAAGSMSTKGMASTGKAIVEAMAKGITDNKKGIDTAISKMLDSSAKKAKDKKKEFESVGKALVQGMIDGIRSKQAALEKEVRELERKAERAVKAEAKIHSPSRVWMKIGSYMGEGLAIGIGKSSSKVVSASNGLASVSADALSAAINSINQSISDDWDGGPVITPVVDLSNIESSAAYINSAFNGGVFGVNSDRGTGLARSIERQIQNGGSPLDKTLGSLTDQLSSMTDAMNSRQLNNYITIDGSEDPSAFADALTRRFKLNARTM